MYKISFLVVDDSATIRTLVERTLRLIFAPEQIFLAEDGRMALEILRREKVDIILSDWNMPNVSGEELLYEVRNDAKLKEIPFIMMTTNGDRDFIIMAIQLGVTQYIVKPFTANELEKKIRSSLNVMNRRREQRYALPEHVATLRVDKKIFSGRLLDISRTGAALGGMKFDPALGLFRMAELELKLQDPAGLEQETSLISGLFGRIVRLEATDTFHPTSLDFQLALYFHPGTMERDVERQLSKLIKWLAAQAPDVIAED
ncbi:response regulator [Desulfurivibrio alkaliphilus]|uniref:Response regulator receiver modulated PilZ sensor protein n=1 Tax=Desulfurivibrio alkaliphilus (strain DSM 19089 / UNIQEM U267 / AHT2) TaxID=589865 RepID=D6Z1Y3_DESAT|nr:response regulator [Desulfurivibrio alkaliphilus]ADH85558.1 response regulator receiver modulated PilZ sensor protein [Desulfurivibrio alkaliphilus AHT 2]